MLLVLTTATTYIDPEGQVFRKGEVYEVSDQKGEELQSLLDDRGVPRFKPAQKPAVQKTAEDMFEKGIVQIPDDMKKGSPGRPKKSVVVSRRDPLIDDEGELDTAAGITV